MSLHAALSHITTYKYDRKVNLAPHTIRLRPAVHGRTEVLAYSLTVTPSDHFLNWQQDPFGNYLARLVFPEPTTELKVEVNLVVNMAVLNPFDFFLEPEAEQFPFQYTPELKRELAPYLDESPPTPVVEEFLKGIDRTPRRTINFLFDLNGKVNREINYTIRMEPGVQSPDETLNLKSGSCRDSTWLLVHLLRHLGLAARFASGYLIQLTPDQKPLEGPSGASEDFTDLHAWAEVYLPGAGWVGLDATSGLFCGEGHLPLACTPEPSSAAPISGLVDDCETEFSFHMSVQRILETPRVTKPYTEDQWKAINATGEKVDEALDKMSVGLTMGGEPTYVSIDDPDGDEWNLTAVSPAKLRLSSELIRRLRKRFAPGAALHFGMGKWYPGETLPRWSLTCLWRKDGLPVWKNDDLIADDSVNYEYGPRQARAFMDQLIKELGLLEDFSMAGQEDVKYQQWLEGRLPSNVTAIDNKVANAEDGKRLKKIFTQGLEHVVGYALPLRRKRDYSAWESGPWFLRGETLALVTGDSPMGLRLPLDALPWVVEVIDEEMQPRDPFSHFPPLPDYHQATPPKTAPFISDEIAPTTKPEVGKPAPWVVRTSLCVEAREGRLYIFLPPVRAGEEFLDLVAAVERTASILKMPVILEGYLPHSDPRLSNLRVAADPGVIEVNVQPVKTWKDLVDLQIGLSEDARQTRLTAEKFAVDGRHTATGGGHHIVLGGSTAAESPILRRPDLLRSLLTYWQHHPSMSYLFSGTFLGPTSQHPRIDEARHDSLYEMETAFAQIESKATVPPWIVDRLFRDLLTDMTGNTHRAEFSVDKLFSPDGPTGRLGLLEMRAFEMSPHPQMSLAHHLLIRALVAKFWDQPYTGKLVRWGTGLHDRFLLPEFVKNDFYEIIEDLQEHGFAFEREWFFPHLEFRFPEIGYFEQRGMRIELRHALETWQVLGEDSAPGGGTSRYVDSSVERIQIKAVNLAKGRYVVTCNGRAVPLTSTGTEGEWVAGVRFKAWQPPRGLHPLLKVHTPLVIDLIDTWNNRSLGGCKYHVSHPGGLSHEKRPVNAFEAETRRIARFTTVGHTPGKFIVPETPVSPEFPLTLDLRKHGTYGELFQQPNATQEITALAPIAAEVNGDAATALTAPIQEN